jgi:hypothetical protein
MDCLWVETNVHQKGTSVFLYRTLVFFRRPPGRGFGLDKLYNSSMTSETALNVTSGTARFEADAVSGRLMLPGTL